MIGVVLIATLVIGRGGVSKIATTVAGVFENWRAPDRRTINIRVQGNHYFRLGLGYECFPLQSPGARLITTFRGSNTVCSPLDWDLRVSEGIGSPSEPCIVKTMTELLPDEVAALPPKAKP